MQKPRIILVLGLAAIFAGGLLLSSPPAESEAGIFRNRFGEPRQPLRRIAQGVRQVAANRLGAGCSGFSSSGCSGVSAAPTMICDANSCSVASYVAPEAAVDDAAAKAFNDAIRTDDLVAVLPDAVQPEVPPRSSDSVRSSAGSASAIPLPDVRLAERERRLTVVQRLVWNRVKARPELRKAIAKYGEARGLGAIDPNNLSAILDVLLAFFEKLLPLILQLFSQVPAGPAPPLVLLC